MPFRGGLAGSGRIVLGCRPEDLPSLARETDRPMHFTLPEQPGVEIVPYLEIKPGVEFTSFPLFAGEESRGRHCRAGFPGTDDEK